MNFPLNCNDDRDKVRAYAEAAGEGTLDIGLYAQLAEAEDPDMPVLIEHLTTDEEYKATLARVQRILGVTS